MTVNSRAVAKPATFLGYDSRWYKKNVGWIILAIVTFPVSALVWLLMNMGEPKHQTVTKQQVDATIVRYAHKGYLVASRSKTQLVLVKKKQFSFTLAILGLLLWGIGLILYILFYLAEKDEILTIAISNDRAA